MPVAFFAGNIRAVEEKADLRAAFACLQAQRVVLIVLAELLGAQAAFADDVRRATEPRRLYPGLQRDRFIQAEA